MFSLIRTAIENGRDSYRYLTWLLKTANTADLTQPKKVEKLLPCVVLQLSGGKYSEKKSLKPHGLSDFLLEFFTCPNNLF